MLPLPERINVASLVVIPSYNEAANIRSIITSLCVLHDEPKSVHDRNKRVNSRKELSYSYQSSLDVLVVDDSSPDGTGQIVKQLASGYPAGVINLLARSQQDGIASAYRAGFAWALERDYDVIVQMDADGSHPVPVVPELLAAISEGADLALGARYAPGGSTDPRWGLHRRALSIAGNTYARRVLNLPYRDLTGGFKAWRSDLLRRMSPVGGTLSGYAFQIHTTYAAHRAGAKIVEVPFHFKERTFGVSKMHGRIVTEGIAAVVAMRIHPPGGTAW